MEKHERNEDMNDNVNGFSKYNVFFYTIVQRLGESK